jgi:HEPN domain-containing protein
MNPETEKWVSKAEGDFHTARRELRARKAPNYDAACFHAQQGAEKYLKAVLVEAHLRFSKTHDLILLLEKCLPAAPLLDAFRPSLAILKNFAVHIRYPGDDATRADARDVVRRAEAVRTAVRAHLGLPG